MSFCCKVETRWFDVKKALRDQSKAILKENEVASLISIKLSILLCLLKVSYQLCWFDVQEKLANKVPVKFFLQLHFLVHISGLMEAADICYGDLYILQT